MDSIITVSNKCKFTEIFLFLTILFIQNKLGPTSVLKNRERREASTKKQTQILIKVTPLYVL